ncbi:MAG: hypothetical protein BWK78_00530 [Thiotrichaceae bacterium IS1]|nr:MAG: hypothetical protein BWK78_00530 [Thiotrichaceae bacterium IS1]
MDFKQLNFYQDTNFIESKNILLRIAGTPVNHCPRFVNLPLALYGAGDLGKMAREYFDRLGIPINFVVDIHAEKLQNDPFWQGLQVVTPSAVEPKTRKKVLLAICVVTSSYTDIAKHLYSEGWTDVVPFYDIAEAYRDRHPLSNGWFATPFSANDIKQIESVLERWADDISRAHHLQFIAWRRLRQEWSFMGALINTKNRYFIPEVVSVLTDQESFADVGAHIGGVSQRFIEMVKSCFQKIWVIEPDVTNLSALQQLMVSSLAIELKHKINIIPVAVGSKNEQRNFFQGLGYASQCSHLGQNSITVRTIDELGLTPSFIKLHIEGWELDALKGAGETLRQYRPIVTVTSYHNHEGLWQLPQWLMSELSNYKFYMRLHSWCGTGAVVYCVPQERFIYENRG